MVDVVLVPAADHFSSFSISKLTLWVGFVRDLKLGFQPSAANGCMHWLAGGDVKKVKSSDLWGREGMKKRRQQKKGEKDF